MLDLDKLVYRQILGIPAETPLENYYDLLGLKPGKHDVAILEASAQIRMAEARKYCSGTKQAYVLELLDEIARAVTCLGHEASRIAHEKHHEITYEAAPSGRTVNDGDSDEATDDEIIGYLADDDLVHSSPGESEIVPDFVEITDDKIIASSVDDLVDSSADHLTIREEITSSFPSKLSPEQLTLLVCFILAMLIFLLWRFSLG